MRDPDTFQWRRAFKLQVEVVRTSTGHAIMALSNLSVASASSSKTLDGINLGCFHVILSVPRQLDSPPNSYIAATRTHGSCLYLVATVYTYL